MNSETDKQEQAAFEEWARALIEQRASPDEALRGAAERVLRDVEIHRATSRDGLGGQFADDLEMLARAALETAGAQERAASRDLATFIRKWRGKLTDVGGTENGLVGIPAYGVCALLDELESIAGAQVAHPYVDAFMDGFMSGRANPDKSIDFGRTTARQFAEMRGVAQEPQEPVAATDEQIDALMPLPVEMGAVYDSAMRAMTCYGFTKDQMRSFARAILAAHAQDVR